eukprot:TRINITY_DN1674_c0_g1_i1.p1 TRINITY_DN1674_c0_g1~~TRINITY_DN1674_c0_g1_i1.p1  ORF type:complete len:188 (-),score=34.66 TRINITY_DN1674_c0_g1_i1:198-761(-)
MEHRFRVFGSVGVGKSALTLQFVENRFVEDYDPTLEDTLRKQAEIDEETCILDIMDTVRDENSWSLRYDMRRYSQGFLFVYSITDRESFVEVDSLVQEIIKFKADFNEGEPFSMMLVGSKVDLESERQVPTTEGLAYAKQNGCGFVETSAKCGVNVEEPFFYCVREIRKKKESKSGSEREGKRCLLM